MKPRIAIINSSSFGNIFPEHLQMLNDFAITERITVPADCQPAQLREVLLPFHGLLASVNPNYPAAVLSQLPNLVAITRHGIGYNNVDVDSATEHGVVVTRVEGYIEQTAVAELSVALLLTAARSIPEARIAVRESRWSNRASFVGIEIKDRTVACIGLGNLGARAASILKNGFNATILGYDPALSTEEITALGFNPTPLEEALARADMIILHCSLTESNYHLINSESLARMQDGVIIVNTARGELVDSSAMIGALQSGKVRTYAADVVEGEPIDGSHPLAQEPNAIIIPHLGAYTEESLYGMGKTMVENMRSIFIDASIPQNAINRSAIQTVKQWR